MMIAATYENGNIFQHFGKTENFKVYQVEDGKIVSSQVVSSNGSGHGALAGVLAGLGVEVVICGGLGGGAQDALAQAGIEVCAGASGDADEAVAAYLRGELVNAGATCDHHDHEEGHSCEDHHCGGSCGSCAGCGGPSIEGKNVGKTCKVHYTGTLDDGSKFDSSYDRDEPLEFVCGAGMMIPGFDQAVADMDVGQEIDVRLLPEDAYGERSEEAVFTLPIAQLPGAEQVNVGERVYLYDTAGNPVPVTVFAKDETTITFDANPPMAGKALNFHILLLSAE